MFPLLLGQQVYTPDTSPQVSGSQAHKEKRSLPLDVNGNTGARIRTKNLIHNVSGWNYARSNHYHLSLLRFNESLPGKLIKFRAITPLYDERSFSGTNFISLKNSEKYDQKPCRLDTGLNSDF